MTTSGEFAGKVVIVTGAGSGIGRGIAAAFAREGATVAVADVNIAAAQETVEIVRAAGGGGEAEALVLDVTSETSVMQAVEQILSSHGKINVLVNNAGTPGPQAEPHLATERDFERLWAVNVKGVWLCTKHVLVPMLAAGKGAIVNIGSISGYIGNSDLPLYHSTKGAVRAMSKTDAMIYATRGIRVNCVNPGAIDTPLARQAEATYAGGPEAYRKAIIAAHPIGRQGRPDDVAEAVLYLASERASFVTGADLFVDGGYTAQ